MGGGRGGAVYMAALVVALVVVQGAVEGKGEDEIGKCLIECSEEVVLCTGECGFGGGKTECYEKCGVADVKCVNSCMEVSKILRRLQPLPIMESDPILNSSSWNLI